MGIRVKLINNYMSIALNALSAEAAVLCEALNLPFDVAVKVMSGTAAGKGHFTTSWPNKVLSGDLSPAFMIDLAHKDLGIALDVANQLQNEGIARISKAVKGMANVGAVKFDLHPGFDFKSGDELF